MTTLTERILRERTKLKSKLNKCEHRSNTKGFDQVQLHAGAMSAATNEEPLRKAFFEAIQSEDLVKVKECVRNGAKLNGDWNNEQGRHTLNSRGSSAGQPLSLRYYHYGSDAFDLVQHRSPLSPYSVVILTEGDPLSSRAKALAESAVWTTARRYAYCLQ